MSISYGELAVIGNMTDKELQKEYIELANMGWTDEDKLDTMTDIEMEMESRGLPHP
jgi:hypothetical protein